MSMNKKKYVLAGTGGRAQFFYSAIVSEFKEISGLLAFCDTNQTIWSGSTEEGLSENELR